MGNVIRLCASLILLIVLAVLIWPVTGIAQPSPAPSDKIRVETCLSPSPKLQLEGAFGELFTKLMKTVKAVEEMLEALTPGDSNGEERSQDSSFHDRLHSGGEGPDMVVIPAGRFRMGCESVRVCNDDEKPVHEVVIAKPFAMSKYEVTFEDYDRFTYPNKADDKDWGRRRRPVINVSWDEATAYAAWLSQETGKRYRLPTEAEWEYAARAGSTSIYSWGDDVGQNRANCDGCGSQWDDKRTAPVGSFAPNAWGLDDMHGNVSEWVQDCWHDSYVGAPGDGSAWTEGGDCNRRVLRGGAWNIRPEYLRSAERGAVLRFDRFLLGFRLARDL